VALADEHGAEHHRPATTCEWCGGKIDEHGDAEPRPGARDADRLLADLAALALLDPVAVVVLLLRTADPTRPCQVIGRNLVPLTGKQTSRQSVAQRLKILAKRYPSLAPELTPRIVEMKR
jgi:hypothetical protein